MKFAVSCVDWNCLTVSDPLIEIPVGVTAAVTLIVYVLVPCFDPPIKLLYLYVSVTVTVPTPFPVTSILGPSLSLNLTISSLSTFQVCV